MEKTVVPFLMEQVTKKALKTSSLKEDPQLWEKEYQKAMTVLKDLFKVYEHHQVTPIEGYTIAAALADTIYAVLTELGQSD